jgi:hypothetical protein
VSYGSFWEFGGRSEETCRSLHSVLLISILILLAFPTDAGETVHYSVCPQEEIVNRWVETFGILVQWSCV